MNSTPKTPAALAQQLKLMSSVLLPTLPAASSTSPPLYAPAVDVPAVLKRLIESEDAEEIAQAPTAWPQRAGLTNSFCSTTTSAPTWSGTILSFVDVL